MGLPPLGAQLPALLNRFSDERTWLFVQYDSIADGRSIPAIQALSGAEVDLSDVNPSVRRTKSNPPRSSLREARECYRIYDRLCERSTRDISKWTSPAK